VVLGLLALTLAACSGPHEGAVAFTSKGSGGGGGDGEQNGNNNGGGGGGGAEVNTIFANEFFPAVAICKSCHFQGTNGAPIFFGEDAAKTYPLFKAKGYDKGGTCLFATRGAHTGPALDATQLAAYNKWVASEGGTPAAPVDAGTDAAQ
jgi:hypothetical protein